MKTTKLIVVAALGLTVSGIKLPNLEEPIPVNDVMYFGELEECNYMPRRDERSDNEQREE